MQLLFLSPTIAQMAAVIADHRKQKTSLEEMERIFAAVEAMSAEEAETFLVAETNTAQKGIP